MQTLTEILAKYPDTDKGTLHSYNEFYSKVFDPKRLSIQTILETGVRGGGSLKAWKEYFINATHVIGVDDGSEAGVWKPDVPGIEVFEANTVKPWTMTQALNRFSHGFFDVIVDDSWHNPYAQVATYGVLRPYLAPGGIYIIEDIEGIEYAKKIQEVLGGTIEDRRNVKGRHDDILIYFTN